MAYCNQDDLLHMISQEELAQLTADSGDLPDSAVVTEAIAKADAEIDSYLGVRYSVPLSPVPAQVKSLSVDLTLYHLYERRSVAPPVRRQRYEAAAVFLRQVAAGLAVVAGGGGEPPTVSREVTELNSATRVFSRNTLKDW